MNETNQKVKTEGAIEFWWEDGLLAAFIERGLNGSLDFTSAAVEEEAEETNLLKRAIKKPKVGKGLAGQGGFKRRSMAF